MQCGYYYQAFDGRKVDCRDPSWETKPRENEGPEIEGSNIDHLIFLDVLIIS